VVFTQTLNSLLLICTWIGAVLLGLYSGKITAGKLLVLNVFVLAAVVEIAGALDVAALVTRNLGAFATAILAITIPMSLPLRKDARIVRSPDIPLRRRLAHGAVLSIPLAALVLVRLIDRPGLSLWIDVDLRSFANAEDNAKWLGAASQLRIGHLTDVSPIGGLLVVLLRGALAAADLLKLLGVQTISSEFASVTFATQALREFYVVTTPILLVKLIPKTFTGKTYLYWICSLVILLTVAQSIVMHFGFLSLQTALFAGTLLVLLQGQPPGDRAIDLLLPILTWGAFLSSWLPLRLYLPLFVLLYIWRNRSKVPRVGQVASIFTAIVISLSTFQYVAGARNPERQIDIYQPINLLESTGGVFTVSPWLIMFAIVVTAGVVFIKNERSPLPPEGAGLIFVCSAIFSTDLAFTGQLGYGSTKLLLLILILVIVRSAGQLILTSFNPYLNKALAAVAIALTFMAVTSYQYSLELWRGHLRRAVQSIEFSDFRDTTMVRLRDPLSILQDYRGLKDVLESEGICSHDSCDLDDIPRVCLTVYSDTRALSGLNIAVTKLDALSSGDIHEYICTRILSEMSRGTTSTAELQRLFFFATGERLRDAIVTLSSKDPSLRVLVAQEGRNQLEIMEVSELRGDALRIYPVMNLCRPVTGETLVDTHCFR